MAMYVKTEYDGFVAKVLITSDTVGEIDLLSNEFREFLTRRNLDFRRVRLYEGSLFLSMLPLHEEAPLRMSCQLIRAIEIYKYYTEEK